MSDFMTTLFVVSSVILNGLNHALVIERKTLPVSGSIPSMFSVNLVQLSVIVSSPSAVCGTISWSLRTLVMLPSSFVIIVTVDVTVARFHVPLIT